MALAEPCEIIWVIILKLRKIFYVLILCFSDTMCFNVKKGSGSSFDSRGKLEKR